MLLLLDAVCYKHEFHLLKGFLSLNSLSLYNRNMNFIAEYWYNSFIFNNLENAYKLFNLVLYGCILVYRIALLCILLRIFSAD